MPVNRFEPPSADKSLNQVADVIDVLAKPQSYAASVAAQVQVGAGAFARLSPRATGQQVVIPTATPDTFGQVITLFVESSLGALRVRPVSGTINGVASVSYPASLATYTLEIASNGNGRWATSTSSAGAGGTPGPQGPGGPSGPPGSDGIDGADGPPGPPGASTPGSPGANGAPGVQGPPGFNGDDGLDGFPGPPGPQGLSGTNGADGLPGRDGFPGLDGLDGQDSFIPGPPGAIGPAGANGSAGVPGPPGEDGLWGQDSFIPGPPGAQGAAGSAGVSGGPGPPGNDGSDGEPIYMFSVTPTWAQTLQKGRNSGPTNPLVDASQYLQFNVDAGLPASGQIRSGTTSRLEINAGLGLDLFTTNSTSSMNLQCGLSAQMTLTARDLDLNASGGFCNIDSSTDMTLTSQGNLFLLAETASDRVEVKSRGGLKISTTAVVGSVSSVCVFDEESTTIGGLSIAAGEFGYYALSETPNVAAIVDDNNNHSVLGLRARAVMNAITTRTNSTTSLSLTGGTYTIPADSTKIGSCFRFRGHMVVTRGATATASTINWALLVAGATQAQTNSPGAINTNTAAFTALVEVEGHVTILTTGAAGTAIATIRVTHVNLTAAAATLVHGSAGIASFVIDTTASKTLDLVGGFGTAVANLSMTWTAGSIEQIHY